MTKTCKKCGLVKSLDSFHKNHTYKDGHVNKCMVCAQAERRARENDIKPCAECNKPFEGKKKSKLCLTCQRLQALKKITQEDRQQAAKTRLSRGLYLRRVYRYYQHTCKVCGHTFVTNRLGSVNCSTRCKNRGRYLSRLARRGEFVISDVARKRIYERDNYTCHLCGGKTLAEWDENDLKNSPSLDHIIPRSQGGPDTAENLRTAHHFCNSVRGVKPLAS